MGRFLLIGLDGAEPSLVERWIDNGRLPNLAQLRNGGAGGILHSTIPPATFPAWTSCVTGVNPGRHGIFDFTHIPPGSYSLQFVNSTFRKAPAVWNILSEAGKRVGVLGVPGTYPPEHVNGFMVSGFDSPVCSTIDKSFVYPPDYYAAARDWRFSAFQESNIGPDWHAAALPKLLEKIDRKRDIALDLLGREPWDFFMVVFNESDTVAHHFWMFHDPRSPRYRPGHGDAILRIYERLDDVVGSLIRAVDDETSIAVVSDHGFGGAGTGVVHLNNYLESRGYLEFAPRGGRPWLKRLAMAVTPENMRGALFRRFPGWAAGAEARSRFGGIDWRNTLAWSEELNYFPSVRINLEGREPCGRVKPGDYDRLCNELCADLETWPPVANARRRDALYHGAHVEAAPDIIIELAFEEGYSHSCLRSRGGPAFRRLNPDEYVGGKERGMNGNHRRAGMFLFSKPTGVSQANIEDIAPTVLAECGIRAQDMDGSSLLEDGSRNTGVVTVSTSGSDLQGQSAQIEQGYTAEQSQAVEKRLRDLGYFE